MMRATVLVIVLLAFGVAGVWAAGTPSIHGAKARGLTVQPSAPRGASQPAARPVNTSSGPEKAYAPTSRPAPPREARPTPPEREYRPAPPRDVRPTPPEREYRPAPPPERGYRPAPPPSSPHLHRPAPDRGPERTYRPCPPPPPPARSCPPPAPRVNVWWYIPLPGTDCWPTPPPERECRPEHYGPVSSAVRPPLLGSSIVASDNTFLGILSRSATDPDSIANPYGRYGDPRSPWSIWNRHGRYGASAGYDSPWDPYASRPPRVYYGSYFWGYLSVNKDLYPRINPYWLVEHLDIRLW